MHYKVLTQWAKAEAASRTAIHDGLSSQRKLSDGFESIGVLGEIKFAIQSELALPLDQKIFSDGGVDFIVPLRFTVDVKTACKASNLILEVGKVKADSTSWPSSIGRVSAPGSSAGNGAERCATCPPATSATALSATSSQHPASAQWRSCSTASCA